MEALEVSHLLRVIGNQSGHLLHRQHGHGLVVNHSRRVAILNLNQLELRLLIGHWLALHHLAALRRHVGGVVLIVLLLDHGLIRKALPLNHLLVAHPPVLLGHLLLHGNVRLLHAWHRSLLHGHLILNRHLLDGNGLTVLRIAQLGILHGYQRLLGDWLDEALRLDKCRLLVVDLHVLLDHGLLDLDQLLALWRHDLRGRRDVLNLLLQRLLHLVSTVR